MKRNLLFIAITFLLAACSGERTLPEQSAPVTEQVQIFPDYRDIIIPPNIAPLNLQVTSPGEKFAGSVSFGNHTLVAEAGERGKLFFDAAEWRSLLEEAKGQTLKVQLYAKREGGWVSFPAYEIKVSREPIDRYLSYRLIEPSYQLYRQMGLYQRDLETFEQLPIYENNPTFDDDHNHCVNCHNFQAGSTQRMLFHVRGKHGGTVFIENDKIEKLRMTSDSTLGNAVYPSWHPTEPWVVFSSNETGQAFHMTDKNKIEVLDKRSDLIFFDVEKRTLSNILKTDDSLETFPCWAPDGRKLYYCSAYLPELAGVADSTLVDKILLGYDFIHYDVMSLTFDPATRQFGTPVKEVDCASASKSASVPRVSPDGRLLLYTLGAFGQFHIWHRDCDLWMKNLETGDTYPLTETNSGDVDSYHSWSSNSRWIVFASRRIDGSYSRPFIAYVDEQGKAYKAFLLPQEDPEQHVMLMKSYNVPELSRDAVRVTPEQLRDAIYDDGAQKVATYSSRR